ncbi:hypothetical protein [Amycolatopsis granulosa]|uniref:hypothetical protein n=1 Tax=Amycolatopsis granulosa TaxID=185684 RepID=UPI0014233A04|nr:hypothetical protein [Amycolatopsis granulosa]NIH84834.1 hypothetical protein [Amycolatopsis granulosa]
MYRVRPSRPMAVFGAVFGVAMIIFVLVRFDLSEPFTWLWGAGALAIVVFNLWAAFSPRGATYKIGEDHDTRDEARSR